MIEPRPLIKKNTFDVMKIMKFFEYVYLCLFVFSVYIVGANWQADRKKAYLFIAFGGVSLLMFFFRRYYRRQFEKRKRNQT